MFGEEHPTLDIRKRYLNEMIRSLSRFDGVDDFVSLRPASKNVFKRLALRVIDAVLKSKSLELVHRIPFNSEKRKKGRDWPVNAETMIGVERLENLANCVKTLVEDNIPGDLVETGVWRGGASIMMRAALEAYGDRDRRLWCADSFEGLPAPDPDRYPQDEGMTWHLYSELSVSLERVKENFRNHGFLDDRVVFIKGWFKDTLPSAPIDRIALLRLDGDLYASTMDALESLYFKVSDGGFVVVDDFGIPEDTCRRAVIDFRAKHNIVAPIIDIDGWGAYWRR